MPYAYPKYPDEIFDDADFPDQADDTNYVYAWLVNALKEELQACLTELGTLPKGDYDDVKARIEHAETLTFHDRGDPSNFDFTLGNLTTDGAWHNLDLSAIVPAGAIIVLLRTTIEDDAADKTIQFRRKDNVNAFNISVLRTQVANIKIHSNALVACNASRIIEYKTTSTTFTEINLLVRGWWK